ncbi:MAG: ParB N-terminal domain-containing protein [Vallitaleaceae bacterium]|nr:ParB N-terminal domain-containing protein [Vallitaleaceae bacterium]
MKAFKMKLADIRKPPRNIRLHTEAQLKEFERSVNMFGQIRPIVIDERNEILAGNGLYDTLIRLGWTEADVYQFKDLTENEKKKLMIADNKIYNLGVDDYDTMDEFFKELHDDLDIPGFDEDVLKNMLSDADDITDTMADYGKLSQEETANVEAAGERMREVVNTAEEEKHKEEPLQQPETPTETQAETLSDTRPSIVCPHCGTKICL